MGGDLIYAHEYCSEHGVAYCKHDCSQCPLKTKNTELHKLGVFSQDNETLQKYYVKKEPKS